MAFINPSFAKPDAPIAHNATSPASDITGANQSDGMQLPLEPLKAFYYSFHIFFCK